MTSDLSPLTRMHFPTLREHTVTLVSCLVKEAMPEWGGERLGEFTTTRGAVYGPRVGSSVLSYLYMDRSCIAFVSFMLIIQFFYHVFLECEYKLEDPELDRKPQVPGSVPCGPVRLGFMYTTVHILCL